MSSNVISDEKLVDHHQSPQKRKSTDTIDTAIEPQCKKPQLTYDNLFIDLKKSIITHEFANLIKLNASNEFGLLEKYFLENKLVFWEFPKWFDLHSKQPRNKILRDYLITQFNPIELNSYPELCMDKLGLKLTTPNNTQVNNVEQFKSMSEQAKHEANILQRISQLRKEGLWSIKRLPKLVEPQRIKTHWDYVLDEMVWMSTDFAQERKWKINSCRKIAQSIQKYFKEKELKLEQAQKEEEKRHKKQAGLIAREIQLFWKQVEKIIEYKHKSINEEKRKVEMDKHLNFIVDQTEKYSSWLMESLNQSREKSIDNNNDDDDDVKLSDDEIDNESTIESDEDKPVDNEIEKLKMESELDLNDLLKDYNLDESYFCQQFKQFDKSEQKKVIKEKEEEEEEDDEEEEEEEDNLISSDEDIMSDDMSDEEDDEETIEQDEKLMENDYDPDKEIEQLEADNDLPIEEILEKLKQSSKKTPNEQSTKETENTDEQTSENRLDSIAAQAESFQPTGYTLETTNVKTRIPSELLKHNLREYQHVGLDWLVTMYENKLNGILADEMGLGKTIQTIALLAHLAVDKGIWGPHLIVVPTSVMLNWELEFKKWCPGFKILTYYGSQKERKQKRIGWTKSNAFHVCITSYKLVIQDHAIFRRKKWKYFILDEAQNIKNFKSQRWQSLLNFQSQRRLLLTGTPLQNNLMELWSLMHFLMPHVFSSHREFQHWFNNPLKSMIEKSQEVNEQLIKRLHKVLRPFILRRLKTDVEKQMPKKFEHIIRCPLSKRQRLLYDEFMSLGSTKEKLAQGHYMSVINILMQLRKVCNHPDLFEPRPIVSPFMANGLNYEIPSLVFNLKDCLNNDNLFHYQPSFVDMESNLSAFECHRAKLLQTPRRLIEEILLEKNDDSNVNLDLKNKDDFFKDHKLTGLSNQDIPLISNSNDLTDHKIKLNYLNRLNKLRCSFHKPKYGKDLLEFLSQKNIFSLKKTGDISFNLNSVLNCFKKTLDTRVDYLTQSECLNQLLNLNENYLQFKMLDLIDKFVLYVPKVTSEILSLRIPQPNCNLYEDYGRFRKPLIESVDGVDELSYLRQKVTSQMSTQFPEKRLIQYDCGKLQCLDKLLRDLFTGEHRVLIFTQMTRMLDVLENFLNYHGYKYVRLDGATSIEQRQVLMERFNSDKRIFCFILSTRSGGVGVNLTGADTVVFYDSDWNPTMDAQAQDRCHRIGQTRDVHIYRLISEKTVEENILKKADQKRLLSQMAIEGGCFTTAVLKKSHITELFDECEEPGRCERDVEMSENVKESKDSEAKFEEVLGMVEDENDVQAAKVLKEEVRAEIAEFDENDNSTSQEPEFDMNKLENEFKIIETELKPIERYALKFLESTGEVSINLMNLDNDTDIEQSKKNWELNHLKRLKEEEERKAEQEEDELMFTYTKSEVRKSSRPKKKLEKKIKNASSEKKNTPKTNSTLSKRILKDNSKTLIQTPEIVSKLDATTPVTTTTTTKPNKKLNKIDKPKKEPKLKKITTKEHETTKKDSKILDPVLNNNNEPNLDEVRVEKEIIKKKRGRKPKPKPELVDSPTQESPLQTPLTERPKILTINSPIPTISPQVVQTPKPIVKAIITRPNLPIKNILTIPSTVINRPNNTVIFNKVNMSNVINVPNLTSPNKIVFRTVPNLVLHQKPASVISSVSLSPSPSSSNSSQSK
ncbi:unnamed protein product [Brachionus calyciflorus]|uniref:Uncharacterized protein n=1 Tax=Brachionus calyciflorus TaxID=104777 RepID=A0A813MY07_9BILA|nr:unnamed protein product [Brachionus calyciflorus]